MKQLTLTQKLNAISHKHYSNVEWFPKTGDYYTTSRADLELYQIVEANESVIRTKYCDPSKGDTVSEWPTEDFLRYFGLYRVWVPDWIFELIELSKPEQQDMPMDKDNEVIRVLDWLLEQSDQKKIDMVDGVFYFSEDKDGDQELYGEDILKMYIKANPQSPKEEKES